MEKMNGVFSNQTVKPYNTVVPIYMNLSHFIIHFQSKSDYLDWKTELFKVWFMLVAQTVWDGLRTRIT